MNKTVNPNELESLQAYNFIWENTKKYFEQHGQDNIEYCIDCNAAIPPSDLDASKTCVDCWCLKNHIK